MDLNLLTIARQNGEDQSSIPGLHIASRPRRPARGRRPDRLILYFTLEGNAPMSPDGQDQLLTHLGQTYYKTPGSVTAALRTVAESLNHSLLDRNLKAASSGLQGLGLLIMVVVRDGRLYLAQCGPTHTILITTKDVQRFEDPNPTNRGLGIGRTTPIYYSQATINPNDTLILTPRPDPSWSTITLGSLHGQELENIRQRLLSQAGSQVNAVLIQAKKGSGKTQLVLPKAAVVASATVIDAEKRPESIQEPVPTAPVESPLESPTDAVDTSVDAPAPEVSTPPSMEPAVTPPMEPSDQGAQPQTPTPSAPPKKVSPVRGALAATAAALIAALGRGKQSFSSFLARLLPGESIFTIPSSVMIFVAIAVPRLQLAKPCKPRKEISSVIRILIIDEAGQCRRDDDACFAGVVAVGRGSELLWER